VEVEEVLAAEEEVQAEVVLAEEVLAEEVTAEESLAEEVESVVEAKVVLAEGVKEVLADAVLAVEMGTPVQVEMEEAWASVLVEMKLAGQRPSQMPLLSAVVLTFMPLASA
jgi:hypothetical protein